MHALGCNILPGCCGARAQPMLLRGLPLVQPSLPPPRPPARVLPFPTFPPSAGCLRGQSWVGTWEILPPPASGSCRLWVTHPGWELKPHCSPAPFLAGLLQQLLLCQAVQPAQEGCTQGGEQDAWTKRAHHVAHSPGVQLGPLLHLCSGRPPCKKGNSSNIFELQQLLLVFL